jgi:DHA1 family multidrug resistance protein-like MFS transporter
MATIFRDAPAGQISRLLLGSRAFSYADERKSFALPFAKATTIENHENEVLSKDPEKANDNEIVASGYESQTSSESDSNDKLVEWYGVDDPDNPQNWSTWKKSFTFFQICLLTFAVYSGSAIITPAQPTFVEIYGISAQASSLVLSMYVLGYVSCTHSK